MIESKDDSISLLQSSSRSVRRNQGGRPPEGVLGAEDFVHTTQRCAQSKTYERDPMLPLLPGSALPLLDKMFYTGEVNSWSTVQPSGSEKSSQSSCVMRLVIAKYHEDISWVKDLRPEINLVVYNKDNNLTHQNSHRRGACPEEIASQRQCDWIELPNIPTEGHSYLHHITEHYQKGFCKFEAFSQADPNGQRELKGTAACVLNNLYTEIENGTNVNYRQWSLQERKGGASLHRIHYSNAENGWPAICALDGAVESMFKAVNNPLLTSVDCSSERCCLEQVERAPDSNPARTLALLTGRSWNFLQSQYTYYSEFGFFAASAESLLAWPEDVYRIGLELFNTQRYSSHYVCEVGYAFEMIWTSLFATPLRSRGMSAPSAPEDVLAERAKILSDNLTAAVLPMNKVEHYCDI